jgi:uncharacterized membrane protein HdeD (DUF308 family)
MNLDERREQSQTYNAFRTSLDMGMGAIYVVLGIVVLSMRYFGTIELSPTTAYVLGAIMILYGAFRMYRGMVVILQKKKRRNNASH